jgi:uncharacterized membrane protein
MNKPEFISILSDRLTALPATEVDKSVAYFSEMIDDRVEDGMSEDEAVASFESIDEIIEKIMYETPLPVLMKARMKPKGPLSKINIVLIILGFPIWFSLLVAGFAVVLSFYVSVWAVIVSLYATVLSLAVSGIFVIVFCPLYFASGIASGLFIIGCGLFGIGLAALAFSPVKALSKLLIRLTAWFLKKIKALFIMNRGAIPRRLRRFHILHPAPQGGILKGYSAVLPRRGSFGKRRRK